jgi:hypothetical protein
LELLLDLCILVCSPTQQVPPSVHGNDVKLTDGSLSVIVATAQQGIDGLDIALEMHPECGRPEPVLLLGEQVKHLLHWVKREIALSSNDLSFPAQCCNGLRGVLFLTHVPSLPDGDMHR